MKTLVSLVLLAGSFALQSSSASAECRWLDPHWCVEENLPPHWPDEVKQQVAQGGGLQKPSETPEPTAGGVVAGDLVSSPHGSHVAPAGLIEAVATWIPDRWERWAVKTAICESAGDQYVRSPSGTYVGWWQHNRHWLRDRARAGGYTGDDLLSAEAQARATAYLVTTGGPGHWPVCGRGGS